MLRTLTDILKYHGFDVSATISSLSALDLVQNAKFDVLLTDIRMPKMDGVDLANLIRKIDENIKIVFFTAYVSAEKRKLAGDYGVVFEKPLDINRLIRYLKI